MSKRKREESVCEGADGSLVESSTKKEAKDHVGMCKKPESELEQKSKGEDEKRNVTDNNKNGTVVNNTVSDDSKNEAVAEKTVPANKNETSSEKTAIEDGKNETTGTKRKRSDSTEGEPSAKQAKTDVKEDRERKPPAKRVYKKRFSKNECVCPNDGSKPVQALEAQQSAHIQVEEWRLHKFQSPIQVNHRDSIHHDHFDPLEFHGHWDDEEGEGVFNNNGFTATLRFYDRELPIMKGGPLHDDQYVFEQLHFHWSEDDHSGCEHIFEGRAYSMEAHAVHYNQKYTDFICAQNKPDGLAVVAFFIQATDIEDNPCFDKLATAVKDIIKINARTKVAPDCLTWFKDAAQCKGYYTYQGSLTTKPYTESVTWILYPEPILVSRQQVANFRSLKSTPCEKHNITKNVRPIQTPPEHKKLNVFFARSHRHSTSD